MPELILRDFLAFAPSAGRGGGTSADPDIREAARSGKGLKITFVASHAGMKNGNSVMYSPSGMRDSSHTWVWPQRQPIQIHHDSSADPIGRVIGARYAPYSASDVSKGQSDSLNVFDTLSKGKITDGARALEAAKVLNDKDWRGVGELILDGVVTDSDAIEKILDGRYQGVSITQRPEQAFCNLCDHDWVKDGPCDHERGSTDEESGRDMYLVVGDTNYVEISYVNRPADPHAMGASIQSIEMSESLITQQDNLFDMNMQTTVSFQLVDSIDEALKMADVIIDDKSEETVSTSKTEEQDTTEDKKETSSEDSTPEATIEEALKCLFEDRANLTEDLVNLINDSVESLVESEAKLSAEKINRLSPSTFCGPKGSFPVPDCAHITAVRSIVELYKGSSDKNEILSRVSEKEKVLGYITTEDNQKSQTDSLDTFSIVSLSDEDLSQTVLDAERLMVERGLKTLRICTHCDEKDSQINELNVQLPDLQDTVKVLRSEYKVVLGEHDASEVSHQDTLSSLRIVLKDRVLTALLLTDKETSQEDLESKVESMTMDELKNKAKEIDISKVISFVRSGLTREPTEPVTQQDAEPEEVKQIDSIVNLSKSLINIRKTYGVDYATRCMHDFVENGKLPVDFTLDKALEIVTE